MTTENNLPDWTQDRNGPNLRYSGIPIETAKTLKIVWDALDMVVPYSTPKGWQDISEAMEVLRTACEDMEEINNPNEYQNRL